jgi:hypothetical protein
MPTTTKFAVDETPTDTTVAHVLAVHYYEDPGWLVFEHESLVGFQRAVGVACRHFKTLEAWWCPDNLYPKLMRVLPAKYKFQSSCDDCKKGVPCSVWDTAALAGLRLEPATYSDEPETARPIDIMAALAAGESLVNSVKTTVQQVVPLLFPNRAGTTAATMTADEAARYLGITLPTTKEQIEVAFRAAAQRAHPDKGGTDGMMTMATQAKATLLKTVAGESGTK